MKKLAIVMVTLLIGHFGHGQSSIGQSQRNVEVGDLVPDLELGDFMVDSKPLSSLGDYGDRLLILDFMATSCSNCIEALPKMDRLQAKYGPAIQILPVTYEKKDRVARFFKANDLLNDLRLPVIVGDTVLTKYFKHRYISHVVWIDKGRVIAMTGSDYVDDHQIARALEGKGLDLPVKNDFVAFDYSKKLIDIDDIVPVGSSTLVRYLAGANLKYGEDRDSLKNRVRDYMVNVPVIQAYLYALGQDQTLPYMKNNRIVLEGLDREKYIFRKEMGYQEEWDRMNCIGFELISDIGQSKRSRMKKIVSQLDCMLGLDGRVEKREIDCWVVSKLDGGSDIQDDPARRSFSDFIFFIDLNADFPPIIDESGYTGEVVVYPYKDFDSLKVMLNKNGLDITKERRVTEVFVLTAVGEG
ncbi:TlpA family protein disulfide reductase [Sphingobacterium sp. SYP-B4668]|uniref:TlpA family protein disulfide reductase n=1 Tax=Sphingobacterium sp. SYP-B4668 TaxID=2996035 RepID=UPI0022DE3C51|nr:TlpA disulfide reductase family protein [Sphingobacterium sp. SYP-B4668]